MSRPSSGGFVLGFAAEIAIVVAVVSFLPRIDLSGGRAGAVSLAPSTVAPSTVAPSAAEPLRETSHIEPPLRVERLDTRAPQITPIPQAEPRPLREPPPLLAVDPSRPSYVERRLDQASQGLVNGLGSYVARSAESFLHQSPASGVQEITPLRSPAYQQPAGPPAPFATGSFPTQPAQAAQPRPWVKY